MPRLSNLISRADLLLALVMADDAAESRFADILGFSSRPTKSGFPDEAGSIGAAVTVSNKASARIEATVTNGRLQAAFFVVTHLDQRLQGNRGAHAQVLGVVGEPQALRDEDCRPRDEPKPYSPLVRRERLWPRLRQSLQQHWCAGIDLPQLLLQVATRRLSSRVPLRVRHGLSRQIVVLWDTADRLTPYFEDYRRLVAELHRLHGGAQLRLWRVHDGPDDIWGEWDVARVAWPERWLGQPWLKSAQAGQPPRRVVVPSGCRLLVLSDLGALAGQGGTQWRWMQALRYWSEIGVDITTWVPHGPAWVTPALAAGAEVHCLTPRLDRVRRTRASGAVRQATTKAQQQRQVALCDELLVRASICIYLEPALLRSLRQTSPTLAAEPGVEALAWGWQPVVRSSHVSRALSPEHAPTFRKRFAELDAATQRRILQCVTDAHACRGRSTEITEVLIWQAHARETARSEEETRIEQAITWTRAWTQRLTEEFGRQGDVSESARRFAADLLARTGTDSNFIAEHAEWTQHLWALSGRADIPDGLDLQRAQQAQQRWVADADSVDRWWLQQTEAGLGLVRVRLGSKLSPIYMARDHLTRLGNLIGKNPFIEHSNGKRWLASEDEDSIPLAQAGHSGQRLTLHYEQTQLKIEERSCPAWADEWGVDQYGLYAVLTVKGVRQRLRYISPGRFRMGSPKGVGYDDERPQHDVLLTEGYWLADTPCTQALWATVMGKNPSEFKHLPGAQEHPVENVSWDDVQTFLKRLAKLLPAGCQPALPTEAQWEYAALAGTTTAYWWGDEPDDQRVNWNEQQKGTSPVNRYPPSPWGLHDMHGNVWEWCLDDRRDYTSEQIRDPIGNLDSSDRAVRGGSWFGHPDGARSAFRNTWLRSRRDQNQGFRFSLRSPSTEPVPGAGGALPRPKDASHTKVSAKASKKKSR